MTRRLVLAIAFFSIVLAACGSEPGRAAAFNEEDVYFAQMMIPHHQQAVEMAGLALDPATGAGADVQDLARRIQAAQGPEIEQMTAWLAEWKQPTMDELPEHDMATMKGMMSDDEMAELAASTGDAFDRMWLAMMVRHHEGAVEMATEVKAGGVHPDVLALADRVIAGQQAEVEEMQALLS